MRRRRLLQTISILPVAPAAAQYSPQTSAEEMPKLRETSADSVAQGRQRLLSADQFSAFRNLADLLVPRAADRPGALDAGAVEFLDFLLSQSAPDRQLRYKNGLDVLNSEARKRFGRPFAKLSASEARPLLEPLTRPWTYHAPKDPQERFLREAKEDLLQATANSQPFAEAMAKRSRAAGGMGAYWLPLD
jgi:hypothetical protein